MQLWLSQGYANIMFCSRFSTYVKNVVRPRGCAQRQMSNHISGIVSQAPTRSCCLSITGSPESRGSCFRSFSLKQRSNCHSLTIESGVRSTHPQDLCFEFSSGCQNMKFKVSVPNQGFIPKVKCSVGPLSWPRGCASTGLICGLLVCYSTSEPVHAECADSEDNKEDPSVTFSHGKKVYTDYSITGEQYFITKTYITFFVFLFAECVQMFSVKLEFVNSCSVVCRHTGGWKMFVSLCCSWSLSTIRETSSK